MVNKRVRAKSNPTPGPSRATMVHRRAMRPVASRKLSFPHSPQTKLGHPQPRPCLPLRSGAYIPSPSNNPIGHSIIQWERHIYSREVDEERGGRLGDHYMTTSLSALDYYEPFPARSLTYTKTENIVPTLIQLELRRMDEDIRKEVMRLLEEEASRQNLTPWKVEMTEGSLFQASARHDRMIVELPSLDQGWQGPLAYQYLNYADGKNQLPAELEVTQLPPIDEARRYRNEELPLLYDDWRQVPNQAEPPRFCLVMPPMPQQNPESRSLPISIDLAVPSVRCADILQDLILEPA